MGDINPYLTEDYWKARQENLKKTEGKARAVLASLEILQQHFCLSSTPVRLIELGCGEGHILGLISSKINGNLGHELVGVDVRLEIIERAKSLYPNILFSCLDYSTEDLLHLGKFDIVLMVNTLHEVFSSCRMADSHLVVPQIGKRNVEVALRQVSNIIKENGYLIIFDGVEYSCDLKTPIHIRFLSKNGIDEFVNFTEEYAAFQINYSIIESDTIELSTRDFTRYITKSIFFNTSLWDIEKFESYQYYTENEFRTRLCELDFSIESLSYSSPSYKEWTERVMIKTPSVDFPHEHILIVAKRFGRRKGILHT